MYHSIGGTVAPGAALVNGGAVVIRKSFSVGRFWEDVVQSKCTLFQYIGEMCRYLAKGCGAIFGSGSSKGLRFPEFWSFAPLPKRTYPCSMRRAA